MKKTLEEEIEEALGIVDKRKLHKPPMAPKSMAGEKSVATKNISVKEPETQSDSKPAIDFSYLADNSSFQRAIMEFIKKFVPGYENVAHRGSKKVMCESFDQNAQKYRGVMNEFKAKVEKIREGGK